MDDFALRQDIIDELEFEPSLDARNIGVAVRNGIATLTGYVGSFAEKATAERVVARVKGVRGIAQEIQVRFPVNRKVNDDEIAERVLKIISWDTTIPDDRVQVKVQDGWVTLSGNVEWNFQKTAASEAVRKLSGVAGITNAMTIQPSLTPSDVKQRIEESLKRTADVDASRIRIDVSGGKVTLEGKVRAWRERAAAERAAWSAPGVHAVDDRIAIEEAAP